jgi:hypothetical protein
MVPDIGRGQVEGDCHFGGCCLSASLQVLDDPFSGCVHIIRITEWNELRK